MFLYTAMIFGWFLTDARERGMKPSTGLKISVVALSLVALPYYKFRYFGARAGFTFIGSCFGSFALTLALGMSVDWIINSGANI